MPSTGGLVLPALSFLPATSTSQGTGERGKERGAELAAPGQAVHRVLLLPLLQSPWMLRAAARPSRTKQGTSQPV